MNVVTPAPHAVGTHGTNLVAVDEYPAPGITVRGWRVGRYLTERGVDNAVALHSEEGAICAARYAAAAVSA